MTEDQFISAARKAAADIRLEYALSFELEWFDGWVNIYKDAILNLSTHGVGILNGYRSFCGLPDNPKGIEFQRLKICAFVEAVNQIEKNELFKKSAENAKDPQPLYPGGPKPKDL